MELSAHEFCHPEKKLLQLPVYRKTLPMASFEFSKIPSIEVQRLADAGALDASKHKKVFENTLPEALSKAEERYIVFHSAEREKAQQALTALQKTADECSAKIETQNFANKVKTNCVEFYNFDFEGKFARIKSIDSVFRQRNDALVTFMNFRGYTALPTRADIVPWKIWLWILGLFVLEAMLNAFLFMNVAGLIGALALTTSQSFINIGTSFSVGRWVISSAFYHPNLPLRFVFYGLWALQALFVVWLNLSLGLFRQLFDEATKTNLDIWSGTEGIDFLKQALTPFSHLSDFDVRSMVVALVGICFAMASFLKGYFADDPHPGFGVKYRGTKKERNEVESALQELRNAWNAQITLARSNTELLENEAITAAQDRAHTLNLMEKIVVDWEALIETMEESMHDRVSAYFNAYNSVSAERAEIPQHKLFKENESSAAIVFKDAIQYVVSDNERQASLHTQQSEIRNAAKELFGEIDKYVEEGTKRIAEFSSKFPSSPIGLKGNADV